MGGRERERESARARESESDREESECRVFKSCVRVSTFMRARRYCIHIALRTSGTPVIAGSQLEVLPDCSCEFCIKKLQHHK